MNLKTLFLTNNECYKIGKKITVKGIVVHSTGANNPNLRRYVGPDDGLLGGNTNNNHWNQARPDGRQVCVHAFIGKLADGSRATYQTLPWDMRGWHGGSGEKGSVNDTHIGFEICEDGLTDAAYFAEAYQEAAELCAWLCRQFSLNPIGDGVIIGHFEGYKRGIASNHGDPNHWFTKYGRNMDTFRAVVADLLDGVKPAPAVPAALPLGNQTLFRVQVGAYGQRVNAEATEAKIKALGHDAIITQEGNLFRVQVGAFGRRANADDLAAILKKQGFDTLIKEVKP